MNTNILLIQSPFKPTHHVLELMPCLSPALLQPMMSHSLITDDYLHHVTFSAWTCRGQVDTCHWKLNVFASCWNKCLMLPKRSRKKTATLFLGSFCYPLTVTQDGLSKLLVGFDPNHSILWSETKMCILPPCSVYWSDVSTMVTPVNCSLNCLHLPLRQTIQCRTDTLL